MKLIVHVPRMQTISCPEKLVPWASKSHTLSVRLSGNRPFPGGQHIPFSDKTSSSSWESGTHTFLHRAQPPADSISADAQRLAAANEGATKPTTSNLDSAEQSAADRLENFESAAQKVAPKMAKDPEHVSK